jgi:predicted RNA-binding Zn ribbon-like protein
VSSATTRLVGGAICLDLANSIDWAHDGDERPGHTEALSTPEDLVVWAARLGLATATETPTTARELQAIRELRRAIHRTFGSIAAGGDPPASLTAALMTQYAEAVAAARLDRDDDRWRIAWPAGDARRIRFAAAVSASELLTDPARLARVRICPGDNCGWLFVDTTGRRRWCSMEVCGSRAKMRRLYARRRR